MHYSPALLLNADFSPLSYFPLSTLRWDRAIKGIYEKTHYIVDEYDTVVRSPTMEMKLPSVVALYKYHPIPKHVAFTRFNVFLRDRYRCQYCGEKHTSSDLTFDHVVPRSRGGKTEWTNVVAACSPCNVLKDDRVEMKPLRAPYQPTSKELMAIKRRFPPSFVHESWKSWLYWNVELEP